MKKKSRIALIVSASILGFILLLLINVFLLFSCTSHIIEKNEEILNKALRTENSCWQVEEVDFSFDFYFKKESEINAKFVYDGKEYPTTLHVDFNGVYFYAWVYDAVEENIDRSTPYKFIKMEKYKFIDENTFILEVKESDFDIPKMLTFHRITQN